MYVINNPVYVPECPSKKSQFERLKEAFFNKLSANKKRVETLRNEVQVRLLLHATHTLLGRHCFKYSCLTVVYSNSHSQH
jgi:hypothetical protein